MEEAPIPQKDIGPVSIDIKYRKFNTGIREISLEKPDVRRISQINSGLHGSYADNEPQSAEEVNKWLSERERAFTDINPGNKKAEKVIGVSEGNGQVLDEVIIGETTPDGNLIAYTYFYDSAEYGDLSDELKKKYSKVKKKYDAVFVSDIKDSETDPVLISEAVMQSSMLMWERTLGRTHNEKGNQFSGEFTDEEKTRAEQNLILFASAGVGEDEENYRQGLIDAGFTFLCDSTDNNENFFTYVLTLDSLLKKMQEKRNVPKQSDQT